jgi:hypothetical protein
MGARRWRLEKRRCHEALKRPADVISAAVMIDGIGNRRRHSIFRSVARPSSIVQTWSPPPTALTAKLKLLDGPPHTL